MTSSNPSPVLSIILFIIFTIFYFIAKFVLKTSSEEKFLNVILSIYLSINILLQLFINVFITKELCGSAQWVTATTITLLPWIMIFCLLIILLLVFPGWLIPFSNTFGYGIAKIGGINKIFSEILSKNIKTNKEMGTVIQELYSNESLLLNEISSEKYNESWESFKNSNMLTTQALENDDLKNKLKKMVILKETVSEFIWYMLGGIFTISASYNYIISSSCQTSSKAAKARYQEYEESINKQNQNQESAPTQMVYTSVE